ncbi:hypothetical protein H0H81_001753 [Sphagnurus paluster]|uniref:Uncharacterized protein n=1 Tax=Sphagnurus paluster TaxID=117069 RepID=A0A9P7GUJ0_9AGAR|nr:hypothetical protein H0H81_001753 [Sphagnurus paluster]
MAGDMARPTISDQKRIDSFFRAAELGRYEINELQTVSVAISVVACSKWSDLELWCRAVRLLPANKALSLITRSSLLDAVKKFGLGALLSPMQSMIDANESNLDRCTLIDEIVVVVGQDPSKEILDWLVERRNVIASSFRKPIGSKEIVPLFDLASKCGGLACLETVMVPRLIQVASPRFLAKFARYLAFTNDIFPTRMDKDVTDRLVTELLTAAISPLDLFEEVKYKPGMNKDAWNDESWFWFGGANLTHEIAQFIVILCVKTYNHHLIDKVVDKLIELVDLKSVNVHERVIQVLLPFIQVVCRKPPRNGYSITSTNTIPDALKRLCRETIILFCTHAPSNYIPREYELSALCEAIICSGTHDLLRTHLVPKLQETNGFALTDWVSLINLIDKNKHRLISLAPGVSFTSTIATIIDPIIAKTSTKVDETTDTTITTILELALRTNNLPSCPKLFTRILPPEDAAIGPLFIRNVLAKVVPAIVQLLQKRQLDLAAEPFGPSLRRIVCLYVDKVLGPKRATRCPEKQSIEGIKQYTCKRAECDLCVTLVDALVSKPEREFILKRTGAAGCTHILSVLKKPVFRLSAVLVATGMSHRGYGRKANTKITKSETFHDAVVWSGDRDTVMALLKAISDDDEVVKIVLGGDYDRILQQASEPEVIEDLAQAPRAHPRRKRTPLAAQALEDSAEDAERSIVPQALDCESQIDIGKEHDSTSDRSPAVEEPPNKKRRLESDAEMDIS